MKKLLIVLSAAALTLLATATTADAGHTGQYVRYVAGYNSCGQPIYSYRYVSSYRSSSYCRPSYSYSRFSYSRPIFHHSSHHSSHHRSHHGHHSSHHSSHHGHH